MQDQNSEDMYDLAQFYNELDDDQASMIGEDSDEVEDEVEDVSIHFKKIYTNLLSINK